MSLGPSVIWFIRALFAMIIGERFSGSAYVSYAGSPFIERLHKLHCLHTALGYVFRCLITLLSFCPQTNQLLKSVMKKLNDEIDQRILQPP